MRHSLRTNIHSDPLPSVLASALPVSVRDRLRSVRGHLITNTPIKKFIVKYNSELSFWKRRFEDEHGTFANAHYERIMLGIAQESTKDFVKGKVIGDFGCGPRGSLAWADTALLRVGIDVLVDRYADAFSENITSHGMVYVKSTENVIPVPSGFFDIVFTVNAIDHVKNFDRMCNELIRILKPGGTLIASFNLEEPPTPAEPQRLTEQMIQDSLLKYLRIESYRLARKEPEGESYAPLLNGTAQYQPGDEGFLWVRATKLPS